MTGFRVGLVTEGPTDQIVIRTLLVTYFGQHSPQNQITFVDLQPSMDRTSGPPEGGWEMVYAWCLRHPPNIRSSFLVGAGLFADEMDASRCDLILVHLDADICSKIGARAKAGPVPADSATSGERGRFIDAVIREWLWPDGTVSDQPHVAAPAVEAIEAWLVAALGEYDSPEEIDDPAKVLLVLDYTLRGMTPPASAQRIKKGANRYLKISQRAAQNVQTVVDRCEWFRALVTHISPHLI